MTCRYYIRETILVQDPGASSKYLLCLWCKHEHSPVTRKRAQSPGAAQILKCDGDLARCEVPAEHRPNA